MGEPVAVHLTQRAGEGLVLTVGIEISGSVCVNSSVKQTSQQLFRNECCPSELLLL